MEELTLELSERAEGRCFKKAGGILSKPREQHMHRHSLVSGSGISKKV